VAQLAEQVQEVHVLTNNCYRDYAQVNARQLVQQLDAVPAPGTWPPPAA
jgi:uncharacterized protein YecE (DUF72 family)